MERKSHRFEKSGCKIKIPPRKDIINFRRTVILWFNKNGRFYPWRQTRDPYRILIAENMLRRTKADQVLPVYERFLKSFPGIDALAEADEKAIEEILSPLGLRWRIPAFKMMARDVREKYSASIPETRKELTSLPGVGDYVAGAVMTMAFGKKEWLVDSNIARIFSRYFGVITSGERRLDRRILEIARIYFSGKKPGRALMGILDISALICKPKKPLCERCPLKFKCIYKSIRKK